MITRRSFLKQSLAGSAYVILAGPLARGGGDEVIFIHISDTHNGNPESAASLRFVLNDIRMQFPDAAFVAATGDITEHGWEEELEENLEIMEESKLRYYNVMGNHDSRWSRTGRGAFREAYGDTHWAIHTGFASIFLIDSSVLLEQYGYLDPFELAWLEDELKILQGRPACIGFHHPPCESNQFIGSERSLFEIVSRHNIPLIMAGHIHSLRSRLVNGTYVITGGATHPPGRGYNIFRLSDEGISYATRNPVEDVTNRRFMISYQREVRGASSSGENVLSDISYRDGSLQIGIPTGFTEKPHDVRLNGVAAQTRREAGKIFIDTDLREGNHEVMLVSPSEADREQIRLWGEAGVPVTRTNLKWMARLPAGIQCGHAFHDGLVITGCNNGYLYGIDRSGGKKVWEHKASEYEILSSPVIYDGQMYLGTIDGCIGCMNPFDGNIIWNTRVDGSVIAAPMIAGDMLIVGTGEGTLYAVSLSTGEVRWKFQTGNLIKATPAFDGERLLFGSWDGYFYCIDADDGRELWRQYINVPHFAPATSNPKIHEGNIYFVSHDYRIHCLDSGDGSVIWQFPGARVEYDYLSPIIERCKPSYSSAVFLGDSVYFCSLTGHVVGFHKLTGEQTFEYELDAPVFDSFPALHGTTMYFGTIRGSVCALDLRAQAMQWSYSFGYEYIFSPPALANDELAIGTLGGNLGLFGIRPL